LGRASQSAPTGFVRSRKDARSLRDSRVLSWSTINYRKPGVLGIFIKKLTFERLPLVQRDDGAVEQWRNIRSAPLNELARGEVQLRELRKASIEKFVQES
jgi:hypothetical protein